MDRQRVVNRGLHALRRQMLLQRVPLAVQNAHRVLVVNVMVPAFGAGQDQPPVQAAQSAHHRQRRSGGAAHSSRADGGL